MFSVPFRSVRSLRVIARESRTPTRVLCYVFISVDKKRVTAIQSFVLWSSSNVCVVEYVTSVFFSAKPVWTPVVLATQPCGRAPPSFETSTRLVETEYTKRQTITRMVETEYTTCRSLSSIYCNASKAFWTKLFTFASTACL